MEALLAAGFVETVFHCPGCGLAGTSLSRPSALLERRCLDCEDLVVTTVLDRFARDTQAPARSDSPQIGPDGG